jgi:protein-disulfide isomerase
MRIREMLLVAGTIAVPLALASARYMHTHFRPAEPDGEITRTRFVSGWRDIGHVGHSVGDSLAPVTIVTFTDYQCPVCKQFERSLLEVVSSDPQDLRLVRRHYPVESRRHAFALQAAVASECAAYQGRFVAFHNALFTDQDAIGTRSWATFAEMIGVADTAAFAICLKSTAALAAVKADMVAGDDLQIPGTPSFLVNDSLYIGARRPGTLRAIFRSALARARKK